MKRKIEIVTNGKKEEREINYIPVRYIFAILFTLIETLMVVGVVFLLAYYVKYFYIALYITVIVVVITIVVKNENPDYKVPWILFVIGLPIVGVMLYFMYNKRVLPKKIIKKLNSYKHSVPHDDQKNFEELKEEKPYLASQANNLCKISDTHLYKGSNLKYYSLGEKMFKDMLEDLKDAKKFIFLEYFIIEEGIFWNSILDILKEKASIGVEVKVLYDDIGCMSTLPGNYYKQLRKYNIDAIPFSKLKGQADGEFNNRSHRKILVIDGVICYTGGVNIADEYINEIEVYGHWKDTGIRFTGDAVNEYTKLFLVDYHLNVKKEQEVDFNKYYIKSNITGSNYLVPFGDGPNPIYEKNVCKISIMNLINQAVNYVYITSPYLIVDNEMMRCIENAALRGVDVRLIVPHIPDKKMVFEQTKAYYQVLMKSNVLVYEYTLGFIHAKSYIADDEVGIIGTMNLDYRSLTHHFENGVWVYDQKFIKEMKEDFLETIEKSEKMNGVKQKPNLLKKILGSIVRIFSPLL